MFWLLTRIIIFLVAGACFNLHWLFHPQAIPATCRQPPALSCLGDWLSCAFWQPLTLLFASMQGERTWEPLPAICPSPSGLFEPSHICPTSRHKKEIRHPAGKEWNPDDNLSESTFRKCHSNCWKWQPSQILGYYQSLPGWLHWSQNQLL